MSQKIFYHVYVSSSVKLMSSEELLKLLAVCRTNNSQFGITGMLLHKDGNFMQVVEGPETETRALVEKIRKDPRHRGIIKMIEGYTSERQFSDWSMGFYELNSPETKMIPGFSEFLKTALTAAEFESNPSRCQRLLLSFKKSTANPGTPR